MKKTIHKIVVLVTLILFVGIAQGSFAAGYKAGEHINDKSRCAVCGMFVAKYPQWLTELKMSDGHVANFDGVKDMMAYYFSPQVYGAGDGATAVDVAVKAYYSQQWIDGKTAHYVMGGDVYGPMGHELVPFSSQAAAESFFKDHHGKMILSFSEITPEIVESLRKGHKMKGGKMKGHKMDSSAMKEDDHKGHSMSGMKQ